MKVSWCGRFCQARGVGRGWFGREYCENRSESACLRIKRTVCGFSGVDSILIEATKDNERDCGVGIGGI